MNERALPKATKVGAALRGRDEFGSTAHAPPIMQGDVAYHASGLVARALAILDDDKRKRDDTPPLRKPYGAAAFATPSIKLQLQRRTLSDGTECWLPIRYFDVQCLVATFLTGPDEASNLLSGTCLRAVFQEDGKAVVDLYCIEYRVTDIGPYNEVGLTILAEAPGDPIPANYVVNLPVTTGVAERAGREIWGYNKFVAAIDVESKGKRFSTILRDRDNELIAVLDGQRDASVLAPPADILTFTLHRGRLMKTAIRVLTPSQIGGGDDFTLKVGTSKHPMTGNLRTLALDGARPALIRYADPFQALLFPGEAL
ncbi:acetoacetate decarboxylase family protein [Roseiarcus sp.]|uniref:acetoacetate decarboxylase family protein n=1 Tax=Roseiarcus sp. TaxID=1969460 RepID=UPI003F996BBF